VPELPEVETMCRGIAACRGTTITALYRPRCQLKPIQIRPQVSTLKKKLRGARIEAIERVGKRPVLRTDRGTRLVFEPRMTGLLLLADPPDTEHLRLCIELAPADRRRSTFKLLFWDRRGLGTVQLLTESAFEARLGSETLGPDALQITAAQLEERLASSQREIKVALLDQRAVAGIGNLYAAEILLFAQIHPQRRCNQLSKVDWQRIASATRRVLQKAIRYEGSTLADGTYRNALNKKGSYQNHHRVYGRESELCRCCRVGRVQRIVQSQRATFFCPECQPLVS